MFDFEKEIKGYEVNLKDFPGNTHGLVLATAYIGKCLIFLCKVLWYTRNKS